MRFRYERGALSDLDEIFSYIARDNKEAAARLVARFEEVVTLISESPYIGEATRKSGFRKFPVGKYVIVYQIAKSEILILYVRHGARRRPWEGE